MNPKPGPLHLLVLALTGYLNRRQDSAVQYLREENRVLRELLGIGRRPSPTTTGVASPSAVRSLVGRS